MNPEQICAFLVITSHGLLLYSFGGYPLLLWLLDRFLPAPANTPRPPDVWPAVSIILSAYNEEAVIEARLRNLLEQDYAADRLEILVGSDGSTDRTCQKVEPWRSQRVQLFGFAERRGKAVVVNDLMARAKGEIIVLTDANTFFHRNAVRCLVEALSSHPSACAVVGQLDLQSLPTSGNLDGLYWRYETWIKKLESQFGCVLGANGAIYAFWRDRFRPIPPGAIIDDFVAPLLIRLHGGGHIFLAPSARAWEVSPDRVGDEFRRRVRIGAGNLQALRWTWPLLLPWKGAVAVAYFSHKVLRWLGPWLLLVGFAASLALTEVPLFRIWLIAQLAGGGLAVSAPWFRRVPGLGPAAAAIRYFLILNVALAVGYLRLAWGAARPFWTTAPRHIGGDQSPSVTATQTAGRRS